jgi:flagellar hook protein FlgE
MSISSAMQAGVTGLISNSSALSAISQNISNANTIGYKSTGIAFDTLVSASTTGQYDSGGVTTKTQNYVSQQGTLQATTSPTDLAIQGEGFFVTSPQPATLQANEPAYFTRAGNFTVDKQGYLENAAGLYLQGWPADSTGNIITNAANLSSLSPINILDVANTASATTSVAVSANLDSAQVDPNSATYAPGDMAAYGVNPSTGAAPDFSISVPISDSQGGQREVQLNFLKSTTPNVWNVEVVASPPSDISNGSSPANGLIETGTVAFNPDGSIDLASANTTLSTTLNINGSDGTGTGTVQWATGLGVAQQSVNLDLANLSQFSAASSVASITTNGTAFGGVSGVSIDSGGIVTAVFDNGTTRVLGQVAIATFPNPDGLTQVSGNAYQVSNTSGAFTLKPAGSAGAGTIAPSSLESSTVDLSTQFTGLIATQEAYSAASKIITTADQMIQQLLNIKQ